MSKKKTIQLETGKTYELRVGHVGAFTGELLSDPDAMPMITFEVKGDKAIGKIEVGESINIVKADIRVAVELDSEGKAVKTLEQTEEPHDNRVPDPETEGDVEVPGPTPVDDDPPPVDPPQGPGIEVG